MYFFANLDNVKFPRARGNGAGLIVDPNRDYDPFAS